MPKQFELTVEYLLI